MKLNIQIPGELLNKAYARQAPGNEELALFRANLVSLLENHKSGDREEFQKNHIRDFLKDTWYGKTNLINTAGDIDLAIYAGLSSNNPVSVIIETKSSSNSTEMMSREKPNAKGFHEIILYYLRAVVEKENYEIKQLVVTNTFEWFIFDGVWFERNVRRNTALVKAYKQFKPDGHDNRHFYESVAKPWLEGLEEPIPCCWFDLREYEAIAQTPDASEKDKKKLIELYKFLSPQHLLKQSFNEKSAVDSTITIVSEDQIYTRQTSDFLSNRLAKIDYRNQPGKNDLLDKIKKQSIPLGDIADVKAGVIMYEKGKGTPPQNEKTFEDRPFSVTGECPSGWKPLYRGMDVTRFTLNPPREFVNYGPWLAAPRSAKIFDSPKLLMRRTDDRLMCAIERESAICVKSCHVIKHKPDIVPQFPYEYLMAILNSRLTQYYFELSNPQMQGKVFAEIKVVYVEHLPIPNATPEQQAAIIDLIDQILAAKNADPKADTGGLEARIDALVYQLYGLDVDEQKIVERTA